VKIRAAVLERTGGPLTVTELALAEPGPGEVLVRLHASGVCHSDQNAIDGTAETRCPRSSATKEQESSRRSAPE
jgi:Zn-dependent alcohol dehydrogenase